MAAAPLPPSVFTNFLHASVPEPSSLPAFIVLGLNRYYPEPSCRKRYGIEACRFWDIFDVTLSDRLCQVKFVLTADAKFRQNIVSGCFIRLKRFSRFWDERSLDGKAIVVVHEVEVVNEKQPVGSIADLHGLPWCDICSARQKECLPLISNRCYYVDNYTVNVAMKSTNYEVPSCNLSSINKAGLFSIRDVITKRVSQYARPAVLVKVMRKCRLVHYVSYSREDQWPFQLPLTVGDKSGWCTVVLWNKLAIQMQQKVHEGSLLYLKNFRVKASLLQTTKSFFSPPQGTTLFPSELSVDSEHPATEVRLVVCQSDSERESLNFPSLELCFMTKRNLISVPDFSTVDIAGLITFVGRVEREARKGSVNPQEDSGAFFYRRWVQLRDSSLSKPITALLYSGEQEDIFFNVKPGQYMLCRHMLTHQCLDELTSSRQKRHGWLITTAYSWFYMFSPSDMNSLPECLRDVVKTNLPVHPSSYSDLFLEGGIFRYPPFPFNIESLQKFKSEVLETIIPSAQWGEICNKMTWRECHQLTVHALFTSITFTKVSNENTPLVTRRSPRKKRRVVENSPQAASNNADESNEVGTVHSKELLELWPSPVTEPNPKTRAAFIIKWRGLEEPMVLNTIKPCAFSAHDEISNLIDFFTGFYDSDLGLVDCERTKPTRGEIKILKDSAASHVNCRFLLLLDVFTNSDNHQLIVLNRAFKI